MLRSRCVAVGFVGTTLILPLGSRLWYSRTSSLVKRRGAVMVVRRAVADGKRLTHAGRAARARLDVRSLVAALLVCAASLAPLFAATADVPVCYEGCSEKAGDGFAVLCVKHNGRGYCM